MTGDTRLFAYASLATAALLALAACAPPENKAPAPEPVAPPPAALVTPDSAKLAEHAPDVFQVLFETSKGNFTVTAHREWSPLGADRFYYLANNGFFSEIRFFRAIKEFMVQFGISGTPAVAAVWDNKGIPDEPVKMGNTRGRLSYAKAGPNTRSTQFFINLVDNSRLDSDGFPAFGEVTDGMAVVDSLFMGYGELPEVAQSLITQQGNSYLTKNYPQLDYIKSARVLPPGAGRSY